MNKLVIALLFGVVAQAACNSNESEPGTSFAPSSVATLDNADGFQWEAGLLWIAAQPIDPTATVDANTAAARSVPRLAAAFTPAGCAAAVKSGSTVTLHLANCNGPFGIRAATGTVRYFFAALPGSGTQISVSNPSPASHARDAGVAASIGDGGVSTTLQIGGGTLGLNATAVLSATGSTRILTVNTAGGGYGPSGSPLARTGQYTIAWTAGTSCALLNGSVPGGNSFVATTVLRGFDVCAAGCPRGGLVTVENPTTGGTMSTSYNGSNKVIVTPSSGAQSTAFITCP